MPENFLKKFTVFFFVLFSLLFIFQKQAKAWGGDIHTYLCPGSYDCNIADSKEFVTAYKWDSWGHLCLDNQPDCLARLGAKYFLKRYFLEDKKDWKLLAAASHLYQDASCPDHWYPMREYFGRIVVPFAPSWVNKVEFRVSQNFSYRPGPEGYNDGWNIPIRQKGENIDINKGYLDSVKSSLQDFISKEPKEDIEDIERQIVKKRTMMLVRSYKEISYLLGFILVPIWLYTFWTFRKKGQKTDLVISSAILVLLVFYLLFVQIFW